MSHKPFNATEFESALRSLVDTDDVFGEIAQKMALQAKVFDLETRNEEISQELDEISQELHEARFYLHRVKFSWRYKIGHFLIRPIELVIGKWL